MQLSAQLLALLHTMVAMAPMVAMVAMVAKLAMVATEANIAMEKAMDVPSNPSKDNLSFSVSNKAKTFVAFVA